METSEQLQIGQTVEIDVADTDGPPVLRGVVVSVRTWTLREFLAQRARESGIPWERQSRRYRALLSRHGHEFWPLIALDTQDGISGPITLAFDPERLLPIGV